MTRRVRVVVHGIVQGVGFRLATVQRARSLGVAGFVRNRTDGAVEAVFEGAEDAVAAMVDWCRRGPRGAAVDRVELADEQPDGAEGFSVAEFPRPPPR